MYSIHSMVVVNIQPLLATFITSIAVYLFQLSLTVVSTWVYIVIFSPRLDVLGRIGQKAVW